MHITPKNFQSGSISILPHRTEQAKFQAKAPLLALNPGFLGIQILCCYLAGKVSSTVRAAPFIGN